MSDIVDLSGKPVGADLPPAAQLAQKCEALLNEYWDKVEAATLIGIFTSLAMDIRDNLKQQLLMRQQMLAGRVQAEASKLQPH